MAPLIGAALISAAGSLLGGLGSSKSKKQEMQYQAEQSRLSDERQAKYQAILGQVSKDTDYYYNQLNRKNKQRGLEQFRQFSTLNQYAPNFIGGNNQIVVPTKPDAIAAVQKVSGT